ncbi:MAG TPA: nicotinate-nucleotide--dimethylbenzimidazole phosphoribosyltransferase [Ktedonobacterales bacterium]|nr:nicotinate-nucleotide--dimethylbenzimidazole phosphoribosyltransferase [Ktedonobacterales bacterium]
MSSSLPDDTNEAALTELISMVGPLDEAAMAAARERQASLTKPAGSLGRLEDLAIQVAGITGQTIPTVARKAVITLAGDHGVTAEGVSAYPAEVTRQMALNFLREGAAINALAGWVGARVVVVDIGVAAPLDHPQLVSRKLAKGTANMAQGPAMTRTQAIQAMLVGAEIVAAEIERGLDLVAIGEMGIGNTTAASAITVALTGALPEVATGRGTGVDDAGLARKIEVITRALEVNGLQAERPADRDPVDVLAKVGGFEIAGMVGVILGAVAQRIPVVLDGFISGAAALVAAALCPVAQPYLIAGHVSVERGHWLILHWLKLEPVLDLHMRLGEGTGAALAMGIVDAALRAHREMATFAEAGVSERDEATDVQDGA